VSEVLQTALVTVQQWCDRTKLSINPKKTKKRNIKGLREPKKKNSVVLVR
jgi:hypothetical protein